TLAMAAKARELKQEGRDIIGLSLGEPDFNVPDFIKEAAKKAIDENWSSYSPVDGYVELKKAIAAKFKRDNNLTYGLDQIVVSTGAKQSLYNVAMAMIQQGDEVILPAPYWVSYSDIVKLAEGVPVEVPTSLETDFKMTAAQLEAAITPRTKMLWFSSPCNPSGSVYSQQELESLAEVLRKHPGIFVVSDEIYEHINFTGQHVSIAAIEGMYDRTITVNGVSKAFAMTGFRIGYACAPAPLLEAMLRIHQYSMLCAGVTSQQAAIEALLHGNEEVIAMREAYKLRRNYIVAAFNEMGLTCHIPRGSFYAFPSIQSTGMDSKAFAVALLEQTKVACVPGSAFGQGGEGFLRCCFATSLDQIEIAVERMATFLRKG
ncbi:MAG: pyridoxal phosphate-dependent aminotransferase, partial [Verrucomicrobia bacterium]|nr:pyridoxal phosphate-dependent aminotransferase [Verrucomicrobiota bacterium]